MNIKEFIKKLPKVELHCHIDGSVRPETILELAIREKIEISSTELEEFKKNVQVSPNCASLNEYLQKFELPLAVMQKSEYIHRIVVELLEDCSFQNIKYAELRFSPFLFMREGLSFEEVMESILTAMKEGKEKYDVSSNLILSCMRHHSPEESIEVVERAKKYLGKGVVAIDLAGNEIDFPPEGHKKAFTLAKEYGFHVTIHAGEVDRPKNISTAIEELQAERIGHGVYAMKDEEVMQLLKEKQIPLEVCITSNVQTQAVSAFAKHPIKKYFEGGIKITLNTDNTTVSNITLGSEYEALMENFDFTTEDLKKISMDSIEVSFASETEKKNLREKYTNILREI